MNDQKDIPRSVIIMLVIVSVIISLLGTWTVYAEAQRVSPMQQKETASAQGEVNIRIIEQPVTQVSTTGQVTFEIIQVD